MDVWQAIRERRSCREFAPIPVEDDKLQAVLEAGRWAPSVLNKQPWRFTVIKNQELKEGLRESCQNTVEFLHQASGWKWLGRYQVDFLVQAPIIIAVTADPRDTGADQFLPGRGESYAFSCCAAIQNMLLAAHALGLGSLWYTLYDKEKVKQILGISPHIDLVSMVVIGYPAAVPGSVPRKPLEDLMTVLP